ECVDNTGKVNALFAAHGEDGEPIAFAVKTVTPADAGAALTVNVASGDWRAVARRQITYSNPPAWPSALAEHLHYPRAGRTYYYDSEYGHAYKELAEAIEPTAFYEPPAELTPHFLHQTVLLAGEGSYGLTSWRMQR